MPACQSSSHGDGHPQSHAAHRSRCFGLLVGVIEIVGRYQIWYDLNVSHNEQVTIGERGRLVLPASVRSALGLKPGTRMLLSTEDDGSLRLRPYRTVADESRGLYADLANGTSLVDELLAERRAEAQHEE